MVYNLIPVNRMPNINIKEIMKLEKSSFRTRTKNQFRQGLLIAVTFGEGDGVEKEHQIYIVSKYFLKI